MMTSLPIVFGFIGPSSPGFVIIGVIVVIIVAKMARGRNTTTIYVVKSWHSSTRPNESGEYIRISGRQEGLIAWLLSLFGIDPTAHMIVTSANFHLETRTFWGYTRQTVPITKISEVQDGFERPWLAPLIFWFLGALCFLGAGMLPNAGEIPALGTLFLTCIFIGIGCYIYIFWRCLIIGVVGAGGNLRPVRIAFKPSFIEGKAIDADAAEVVGKIIQALIDRKSDEIVRVLRELRSTNP